MHWPDLVRNRLFWGKDRAVTIGTLTEQIGVSRRIVERAIEDMRLQGVPVVTGSAGVWLTVAEEELAAAADHLEARAVHQLEGARALRATAARYGKVRQMEMFG